MWPSISSRRICLPTVKGEAERLTIACAPALASTSIGSLVIAPPLPEIAVVPDVFADADAQAPAVQFQNLRPAGRLEVAVFVEDVVGRQQRLVKGRPHRAVAQQHRAVEQGPAHVGRDWASPRPPAAAARPAVRRPCAAASGKPRRTKPWLISRSRGRYPMRASSGVTAEVGARRWAWRTPRTISAEFPPDRPPWG